MLQHLKGVLSFNSGKNNTVLLYSLQGNPLVALRVRKKERFALYCCSSK